MPDQPDDITRLRKTHYALEDLPETIAFPKRAGDEPREPLIGADDGKGHHWASFFSTAGAARSAPMLPASRASL